MNGERVRKTVVQRLADERRRAAAPPKTSVEQTLRLLLDKLDELRELQR